VVYMYYKTCLAADHDMLNGRVSVNIVSYYFLHPMIVAAGPMVSFSGRF